MSEHVHRAIPHKPLTLFFFSDDCSVRCSDDPSRTCGGLARLNEFSFQCSGGSSSTTHAKVRMKKKI